MKCDDAASISDHHFRPQYVVQLVEMREIDPRASADGDDDPRPGDHRSPGGQAVGEGVVERAVDRAVGVKGATRDTGTR
ncbi:MAG: hypothetical protein M3478_11120 [Planctomycetota bacterium]|nr:hypothetical protein [Planctomycetota bacterium]